MKKNVIVMTIIGMLLLSSFVITPVLADGTGIIISNEQPEDGAVNVSILLSELSFQLNESQGNAMDYTVETNPYIGSGGDRGVYNDTYSVSVIGPLDWNTVYTWYVNVTNGTAWNNETFTFTTLVQPDLVYVDDDADPSWYDYAHVKTIEEALENVTTGGTIYVYNGTYDEHVILDKTINLVGEDKVNTIINGSNSGDVINISADHVKISGFTIEYGSYGIEIYNSSNNTIMENTIKDNNGYGIYIDNQSKDNVIYHNNFNNTRNANDSGTNSIWDNGYPSGGNYWHDYTGTDADGDGIGDTPYNITEDGSVQDRYPLINPFGENLPVADFTYTVDETTVKFTSSSYDRDGDIVSYYWEFGDGANSTEPNPEHTYAEEYKTYTVNLTVTDNDGKSDTVSKEVTTYDTTKPTIKKIVKPERALYIRNQKIRRLLFRMAFIIGDITIEVNASDEGSGIEKVEFYAGLLGTKYLGNDTTEPYSFNWTRGRVRFFHIQILTVKAYDNAGNIAVKRMIVRKLL